MKIEALQKLNFSASLKKYVLKRHVNCLYLFESVDGLPDGHLSQTRPVFSVAIIVCLQLVAPAFARHVREARVQQGRFSVVVQQGHVHGELRSNEKESVYVWKSK